MEEVSQTVREIVYKKNKLKFQLRKLLEMIISFGAKGRLPEKRAKFFRFNIFIPRPGSFPQTIEKGNKSSTGSLRLTKIPQANDSDLYI